MSNPRYFSAGENDHGELCRDEDDMIPSIASKLKMSNLVRISTGSSHCAALYSDGSVYVWGRNEVGELGLERKEDVLEYIEPTKIEGLPKIKWIKCGCFFTTFLGEKGEVYIASNKNRKTKPYAKVPLKEKCTDIFGFYEPWITCESGSIFKINRRTRETTKYSIKFASSTLSKIKEIVSIGYSVTERAVLCLTVDGKVYGIGEVVHSNALNTSDSLNKSTNSTNPENEKKEHEISEFVIVESLKDKKIIKISGVRNHFVALSDNGEVFVWGYNDNGQLGLNLGDDKEPKLEGFVEIPKFSENKIIDIAAGNCFTAFIDADGDLWSTGWGLKGKSMLGDDKERTTPEKSTLVQNCVSVNCSYFSTFVCIDDTKYPKKEIKNDKEDKEAKEDKQDKQDEVEQAAEENDNVADEQVQSRDLTLDKGKEERYKLEIKVLKKTIEEMNKKMMSMEKEIKEKDRVIKVLKTTRIFDE